VAAGLVAFARRAIWGHSEPLAVSPGIDPADVSDIEGMLAAVDAELSHKALVVVARLAPLVGRRVPTRVIEAAPVVPPAARLRFADGTTLVVRSDTPGDVGKLVRYVHYGSVWPASFTVDDDGGIHLWLTWLDGAQRRSVRVLGLDQPD
jgi:hypothetical protein